MDISVNLNRTCNPKYTHYTGDGNGRDSYIVTDNGGFLPHENFITPQIGYQRREVPS